MRYLLSIALLLSGLTSLHAATFLERFNALEQDIQNVQDEVDALKKSKGSASGTGDKSLKQEIEALKKKQKSLEKSIATLKGAKGGNTASDKELKALQDAVKKLKGSKSSATSASGDALADADMDEIQEQFDEISKSLTTIRKFTNGNHMKITADFRSTVDHLDYRMANGDQKGNDAVFSNRLWVNMKYKATQNISFTGQLAYNKTYGARSGTGTFAEYDKFDWITNEKATTDDTVRVRKAYFFYANETFAGLKMPWTFSVGRRPSTNGHLAHFREDDEPSSPMAHAINVEFDGLSSKFDLSHYTGISGQYIKFCLGRGGTNAAESLAGTPYATTANTLPNIDITGAILSLYNNGHYALTTQAYHAKNLIDLNQTTAGGVFENVGDLTSFTANFVAEGIGEEGSDFLWSPWLGQFLDNTIFFVSYASSMTRPYRNGSMLGTAEDKVGRSYWAGLNMPTLSKKGRWGLEYNHGDKYWRPITYAEDTLIGSKIAARGDAYEIYWTEPFANDVMSWQLRFTYIDYEYTGSNGFFGDVTGTPTFITSALGAQAVDRASDLRFYLRYRY